MISEKFMPPYIDFIQENFHVSEHQFIYITSEKYQFGLTPSHNVKFIHTDDDFLCLVKILQAAEKIILHGLWRDKINNLLITFPDLLQKSYWVMWGADFYNPDSKNDEHKKIIETIGHLVSYSAGDIQFVRTWYGAKGHAIINFAYPSNLYQPTEYTQKNHTSKNILLGNSGATNNNHLFLLEQISKYKHRIGKVYTPLSYANKGHPEHIKKVIKYGNELFGDQFIPMTEFLPFDEYKNLLKEVDIALFDHDRQQAMGTIVTLLSYGCRVFIRPSVTTWDTLKDCDIKLFDIAKLDEGFLTEYHAQKNINNIKKHFSKQSLVHQWQYLFNLPNG
ncbi:TDP-N-acetylfucosamine:lipid II N-acetylfucosaminyltransferase [Paraglaciecola mesophila]|nr:TDP-N-acetylfucosamine:lipid II N-acetylfucosaminyltransferase [Paraglaciecola mesophila]